MSRPEQRIDQYPYELSGGMRQRAMIAMALSCNPELLIADEPTTALDVTTQAQILELMLQLKRETGAGIVVITHDLGVVAEMAQRVAVMYLGRLVEIADRNEIYRNPLHPYTKALLSAVPIPDPSVERTNIRLSGTVPSALDPPSGCRFHTRCPRKIGPICEREPPPWREVTEGHRIYCHIDIEELRAVEPVLNPA